MTQRFSLLAFLLLSGISATAQRITIMPKAGADIYYMNRASDISNMNQKPAAGFTGGAAVDINLHRWFSIQSELLYITKGYSVNQTYKDAEGNIINVLPQKYTFSYLQIPVLAKASYNKGNLKLYGLGGASFDYGFGGIYSVSFDNTPGSGSTSGNYPLGKVVGQSNTESTLYFPTSSLNRMDITLQFGGGIGYKVGPGAIIFDARCGIGLTNFVKSSPTTTSGTTVSDLTSKSRTLSFTIGYAIPLGK
jgi:hypothetical protein